jgi:4,5-DOPA dioxygenase extradiol
MGTSPSRREFLRFLGAGAGAAALGACRARGLDPVAGRVPLLSGMTEPWPSPPPAARGDVVPAAFVGHGSPMTVLDPGLGSIWTRWAESMPRPKSILVVSAHWEENPLMIGATTRVPLVYDYYGFPAEMYRVRYDAPPAPELGDRVEALLRGVRKTDRDAARGLDHGAFAPLRWLYPKADVPVLEISIPTDDPRTLFAIGKALSPLRREGTLILGSGNVTHNLRRMGRDGAGTPSWASDFDAWTAETLGQRRRGRAARLPPPRAGRRPRAPDARPLAADARDRGRRRGQQGHVPRHRLGRRQHLPSLRPVRLVANRCRRSVGY